MISSSSDLGWDKAGYVAHTHGDAWSFLARSAAISHIAWMYN
jgi:hypothetical protein